MPRSLILSATTIFMVEKRTGGGAICQIPARAARVVF